MPTDQLPVQLPDDVSFDKPGNLRPSHMEIRDCPLMWWPRATETDTMDTFVDSSGIFTLLQPLATDAPLDEEVKY